MTEKQAAAIRAEADKQAVPLAVALLLWLWSNPDPKGRNRQGGVW